MTVMRGLDTVSCAYNGLDTRTSVTSGSNTYQFLRDGAYVTDPVLVDSGATYTPGISERRGTTTTYLHSGLKNAFAQSGTSQNVTATREYDAFGNVTAPTGSWAGPFGYAGKFGYQSPSIPGVTTPDEGITLMGHRYYDSSTGRFLTRDPIFDGRNWYSYSGGEGNPVTSADPNGLKTRPLNNAERVAFREALGKLTEAGLTAEVSALERMLSQGRVVFDDGIGDAYAHVDNYADGTAVIRLGSEFFNIQYSTSDLVERRRQKIAMAGILIHEYTHVQQGWPRLGTNARAREVEAYNKEIAFYLEMIKHVSDPDYSGIADLIEEASNLRRGYASP